MGDFDEGKHPRADDGKFSSSPGAGTRSERAATAARAVRDKARAPGKPRGKGRLAIPKGEKFDARPHERSIAKLRTQEAKFRTQSIAIKSKMAALKTQARANATTPAQRARYKARFDKLDEKRRVLQGKADAARAGRADASKAMQEARAAHTAKRKEARAREAAKRTKKQIQSAHEGVVNAAQNAKDAADDVDFARARKYLAQAEKRHDAMVKHLETAKAKGIPTDRIVGDLLASAERQISDAKGDVDFEENDRKRGISDRAPPERGALRASEYRQIADRFATKLTNDQKLAVSNYSDHTDRILNPLLRSSKGNPEDMDMYSGTQVPIKVHVERLAKRRERRNEADDYPTTVREEMKHLDAAIASYKFDRDVVSYRVIADPHGAIMGGAKKGVVWHDHGYVSTTADKNVLSRFYGDGNSADRVNVRVTIRKGTRGAPMARLSTFDTEKEILLPRGSRFRITKVVPASGGKPREIHMETVV